MELRQLRYFAKAAETLNFSDAARALNIAQSTLSQQIRQLEDELGVRLFERGSHNITLTEAGQELLAPARQTLRDADTCLMKVNDLSNLLTGTLDIGVTYSFSPILTETILGFMKAYPQVKLNIYYKPMAELMEMLKNRMVDFALAFRPTSDDPEIESHVLFDNHLAVIVSQDHPLSTLSGVNLRELEKWPLALPARGLQARNAFESLAEASASAFKIKIELNEVNILLELIKNSRLVTVLAEATVYNAKGIKAIPLILPLNRMDGCVHMLRDCYRKKSAIKFIEMLKDSAAVRARVKDWFR